MSLKESLLSLIETMGDLQFLSKIYIKMRMHQSNIPSVKMPVFSYFRHFNEAWKTSSIYSWQALVKFFFRSLGDQITSYFVIIFSTNTDCIWYGYIISEHATRKLKTDYQDVISHTFLCLWIEQSMCILVIQIPM